MLSTAKSLAKLSSSVLSALFDEKYEVEENVFEYDVPEGKLFVMGDNRNNSTDSRRIGFIDPSDVLGKAVLRLYPFDSFGKVS